ncbi:MAG TPA: DEAD/DEAH box helicase, partial [Candidatus Nanoarchaeia archaeon]|nr:DEAD/DEAH box helicase [Candidatus Nanoarchaeia archaeon]
MIRDFTPRLYQQTILGSAAAKNTLVVLPTGLGKTGLALLLAAQRLAHYPNSKILMLSPTKPLCEQHVQTFRTHLDIPAEKIVLFTGNVSPEKREVLWKDAVIVISTPQGLENDCINNRVKLEEVSLLCFDECHHAVKEYAYVWIAQQYEKKAKYPRILALTASPGSDLESIKEICKNLYIEKVEVRTEQDSDVKPYIQQVKLNWIKVDFPEEFKKIQKYLRECKKSKLIEAQHHGYCNSIEMNRTELIMLQQELHLKISQGQRDFEMMRSISLLAEALKVEHALELLESQGISQLHSYFTRMQQELSTTKVKAVINLLMDENFKSAAYLTEELVKQDVTHPKLIK